MYSSTAASGSMYIFSTCAVNHRQMRARCKCQPRGGQLQRRLCRRAFWEELQKWNSRVNCAGGQLTAIWGQPRVHWEMYGLVWKNNFDNVNFTASFNKDSMFNDVGTSRLSGRKNGRLLYDLALQTTCPCIFYRHICVAYVTKLAKMCHSALGSHLYPLNLAGEKKSHSVLNYI